MTVKQTHCKRGHPLVEGNIYYSSTRITSTQPQGRRACRACNLDRAKTRKRTPPSDVKHRPTCNRGHPMSGDNLYESPAGHKRMCRTCSGTTSKMGRPKKTECIRGHPITEGSQTSDWACRKCRRIQRAIYAAFYKSILMGESTEHRVDEYASAGYDAANIVANIKARMQKETTWDRGRRLRALAIGRLKNRWSTSPAAWPSLTKE